MDSLSIPVSNSLIREHLKTITPKGFTILSYLLIETCIRYNCSTSIQKIQTNCGFKDHRTVRKFLKILQTEGLIEPIDNVDFLKVNSKYLIDIDVLYKRKNFNGYRLVPVDFFYYFVDKIDSIGWTIFCTLIIYINTDKGYAYPSFEQLEILLGLDHKTIQKYIGILIEHKLLKIKKVEYTSYGNSKNYYFLPTKILKKF